MSGNNTHGETAMYFKRKLRKLEAICDKDVDCFDCDACLWLGVTVPKGDVDSARRDFDGHNCGDHINQNSPRL
jgi:hypothetical protein